MTNREIARTFNLLGKIMELHDENPFKTRSYTKAYNVLRKVEKPLAESSEEEISAIEGVGAAISAKIIELLETGEMQTLNKYQAMTPVGVQEMLHIKGFGPKKIKTIWRDLGIDNIGELLYACNENRLVAVKGFGAKTQENLRQQLEYFMESKGKYHYATLLEIAEDMVEKLQDVFPQDDIMLVGQLRRKMPVVDAIELLTTLSFEQLQNYDEASFTQNGEDLFYDGHPLELITCEVEEFESLVLESTGPSSFLEDLDVDTYGEESVVFENAGLPFILPELRDMGNVLEKAKAGSLPEELITVEDIKGIVHNHSTYSDGIHTLRQMAEYVRDSGFEYLVISDHSKAAFYANGLSEDRILMQQREIDALNEEMAPFKIFKSIECDILADGSLDYEDDVLETFDLVISSVHSNLKMDQDKAMRRLIAAIENPYTHILGHPTGRLLLSREGYPIDHKTIIDACADHNVIIELNANPHRLDLDWQYIDYAIEKGVKIAINPDAHSKEAIHYIKYGVAAARKGGLTRENCLNTLNLVSFQNWVDSLH
jgi:DNA polymerase (family 10)